MKRGMTAEGGCASAFSRHDLPEVFISSSLDSRGSRECRVRAAPAVSCARLCEETHTSIQVQRRQSGIPCAMVLRLMPCSPRRRILFVTVASGLRLVQARLGRRISAGLTSATDARTTRFCRTQQAPFVLRAVNRSRVQPRPATPFARRRCRVHRIPSRVRDDRDTPLLPGKDGASW